MNKKNEYLETPASRTHDEYPALPARLVKTLRRALPSTACIHGDGQSNLPRIAGSYLLIMHLPSAMEMSIPRASGSLMAGWYLYAGSAHGPGGIAARVRRHLRKDKIPRWHVDALTGVADVLCALPFPANAHSGLGECEIIARLMETDTFRVSLPGFGSSDCNACPAHLLFWEAD